MRRLALLIAAAAALEHCASPETSRLEIGGLNLEYGFLIIFDADDQPTRVTPPFGIEGSAVAFGELPAITFSDDEKKFVLVTLDDALIARDEPAFVVARAREITSALKAPEVRKRVDLPGDDGREIALPEGAGLFTGELGSGVIRLSAEEQLRETIARSVTIALPVDPEYCRVAGETPLASFTGEDPAFARVFMPAGHVNAIKFLDDERVLALTWNGAAILHRGQRLDPGPNTLLLIDPPPEANRGLRMQKVAIDPTTLTSSVTRVLAGARDPATLQSELVELEIRGDVITLLDRRPLAFPFGDVAILRNGRQIISGYGGELYERNPRTRQLTFAIRLATHYENEEWPTHLLATDDDQYLLIASTQARVHVFDSTSMSFDYEELQQAGLASFDDLDFALLAAAHTPNGELEIWAGAERASLYRRIGSQGWRKIDFEYPPRFLDCEGADDDTGEPQYLGGWNAAVLTENYLHIIAFDCSALLQVRRDDLCVSVLPRGADAIGPTRAFSFTIDARHNAIAVGGLYGIVYGATW